MQVWIIEKDHIPLRDRSWPDERIIAFPDNTEGTLAAKHWLDLGCDETGPIEQDGHYYDAVLYKRIESQTR